MEKCQICSKTFKLKSSLKRHLSTTSCGDGNDAKRKYECTHCTYETLLKTSMTRHFSTCKYIYASQQLEIADREREILEKAKEDVEEQNRIKTAKIKLLRQKIKDLEEEKLEYRLQHQEDKGQLKVYKERPSTTINTTNYINPKLLQIKCDTIRPFTLETVREDVQAGKFTFERFIKAEKGLLEFISDIIAKDTEFSYVCTDSSRQKFHRLLESREWKDDNGATFLNKVLDELKEPATTHYKRITDMMVNGDRDTADFLRSKTKPMVMGITCPTSKDRESTFIKVRNEVKRLATI